MRLPIYLLGYTNSEKGESVENGKWDGDNEKILRHRVSTRAINKYNSTEDRENSTGTQLRKPRATPKGARGRTEHVLPSFEIPTRLFISSNRRIQFVSARCGVFSSQCLFCGVVADRL